MTPLQDAFWQSQVPAIRAPHPGCPFPGQGVPSTAPALPTILQCLALVPTILFSLPGHNPPTRPPFWGCFHLIMNSFRQRWSFIICWYSAQKNGILISRHYCNINNNNSLLPAFSNSTSFTGRWWVMLTCLSTAQKSIIFAHSSVLGRRREEMQNESKTHLIL